MKQQRAIGVILCMGGSFAFLQDSNADPVRYSSGIDLGSSATFLVPDGDGLLLGADAGPLSLRSSLPELLPWDYTGGIHLEGTPIRLYLGAAGTTPPSGQGVFEIWPLSATSVPPTGNPLFAVNGVDGTAGFSGLNVSISGGTLKVSGSNVITEATLASRLQAVSGQVNIGNGTTSGPNSVAIGLSGPIASQNGSVAIGKGNASGALAFASGDNARASGVWAVALGYNALASGNAAVALSSGSATGYASLAAGYSGASGTGSVGLAGGGGIGDFSVSLGYGTQAKSYSSVVVGSHNAPDFGNTISWIATDPVFTIGNGRTWGDNTNAMVTLKNGQTTLRNKKWSYASPLGDPDPLDASDANGTALIVEGHTDLRGKVTIRPQGDISMGIYE